MPVVIKNLTHIYMPGTPFETKALVEPGTYGAFVCQPEGFGTGMLKAKAIDDRIGCAILLELLREEDWVFDRGQYYMRKDG